MSSWVPYSVAVYIGLLMAGSLGAIWPRASAVEAFDFWGVNLSLMPCDREDEPGPPAPRSIEDLLRQTSLSSAVPARRG